MSSSGTHNVFFFTVKSILSIYVHWRLQVSTLVYAEYWLRIGFQTICDVTDSNIFKSDFQWAPRLLTLSAMNVKTAW